MSAFEMPVQIRWSDIDPNFHLRHSVYYDWGTMCRLDFLVSNGLSPAFMQKHSFAPIIFREEAVFRKEVKPGDQVRINLQLLKARKDFSRWTIFHEIRKEETLCATITIDGAWIHMKERKLFVPPPEVHLVFEKMGMGKDFEWTD